MAEVHIWRGALIPRRIRCKIRTSGRNSMNERFFPKGAIASFGALIAVYVAIWFAIYLLMVSRG